MKTIKIAHLYYNLMNLYGESGNLMAIKNALDNNNIKYKVNYLTANEDYDLSKYNIVLIGSGTEANQELARTDILKHKKEIEKIFDKSLFIITGNAIELFGKKVNNKKALSIFDFESKITNEKIVSEQVLSTSLLKNPIIGFQNRFSINNNDKNNLFEVISGNSNDNIMSTEGITINNFYGTYNLGPLLIRNPHLTDYILKKYLKENKIDYKNKLNKELYKAYDEYLNNFNIKKD